MERVGATATAYLLSPHWPKSTKENEVANATNDGWSTVSEEIPTIAILDEIGDVVEGKYVGPLVTEMDDGSKFTRYVFIDGDGERLGVNSNPQLKAAMGKVSPGDHTRVTLTRIIPTTGDKAMKEYLVQTRR